MTDFCTRSSSVLQILGYFIFIVKIVLPLIIIILGSIDVSKAVLSGDEKDIKTSVGILVKRLLIGIAVFLLPSIVRVIFYGIYDLKSEDSVKNEANICIDCLTNPSSCQKSERVIFK